jgi:hypothetical protein
MSAKARALTSLGFILLLAAPAVAAEEAQPEPWTNDVDAALEKAEETGRPVLVYVLDSI